MKFPSFSLAARVTLGAAILVAICAIALVQLIVGKAREAYLADRGAVLINQAQQTATRFGLGIESVRVRQAKLARSSRWKSGSGRG